MKKRQLFAVMMAAALTAISVAGCGSSAPAPTTAAPAATTAAATEAPAAETEAPAETEAAETEAAAEAAPVGESFTLSLATTQSSSTAIVKIITEMADNIRDETGGTVDIQIYPDSTLGGQNEYLEGVSMGTVDMCLIASAALEGFYDQYAIYALPFLLKNVDQAYKFYESEDGQAINNEFKNRTGIKVIDMFDEGYRQVFTKRPVHTLADFAGLKIRVPDVPLLVGTFNGLGCNATIVPLGDLYTGLQTGLVDSFELPTGSAYGNSVYEQVDYCTITNHIGGAMFVLINDNVWSKLSPEQQEIISKYAKEASEKNRQNITTSDQEQWEAMKESGIEFIELTDEAREEIVEAMNKVIDDLYGGVFDPAMLDRARALQ